MSTKETEIWSGTPSQVTNFGSFIFLSLFFWLIFPLFIMLWQWLVVRNTTYDLTTQRLTTRQGVFSKQTDALELYRVRDYRLEQPFFLRLFSLGNIVLTTSDRSHPKVTIQAVRRGARLYEQLRTAVEDCRTRKQVREIDIE